jgi:hypothetical protein
MNIHSVSENETALVTVLTSGPWKDTHGLLTFKIEWSDLVGKDEHCMQGTIDHVLRNYSGYLGCQQKGWPCGHGDIRSRFATRSRSRSQKIVPTPVHRILERSIVLEQFNFVIGVMFL